MRAPMGVLTLVTIYGACVPADACTSGGILNIAREHVIDPSFAAARQVASEFLDREIEAGYPLLDDDISQAACVGALYHGAREHRLHDTSALTADEFRDLMKKGSRTHGRRWKTQRVNGGEVWGSEKLPEGTIEEHMRLHAMECGGRDSVKCVCGTCDRETWSNWAAEFAATTVGTGEVQDLERPGQPANSGAESGGAKSEPAIARAG